MKLVHFVPAFALVLFACGGSAEPGAFVGQPDPKEGNALPDPNAPATSPSPGTAATPAAKLSSLGTEIVVDTSVFGAPAKTPGDTCSDSTRNYELSLATGAYKSTTCAGDPGARDFVVVERTLSSDELASVNAKLEVLTVAPLPKTCSFDGRAFSIKVGGKEYWDYDYNCRHRTDVGYVAPNLAPLEVVLRELAK